MLTDDEQAAHALADVLARELGPDAVEACSIACGLLAARYRQTSDHKQYAIHVQHLAAQVARHSGALDDHRAANH